MVAHLKEIITSKQRDISRVITPHIQSTLLPEYTTCAAECGSGMYMRIKTCMAQGIDTKRTSMFDEATESLVLNLMDLQVCQGFYLNHRETSCLFVKNIYLNSIAKRP